MTLQELYVEIGGDYAEVRGRLPSDKFIQKFVLKFVDDKSYELLLSSLEQGNGEFQQPADGGPAGRQPYPGGRAFGGESQSGL